MKLIFVLILIVGIMAWCLMPSKPRNGSPKKKKTTTVQKYKTTRSSRSTGKAIWDGKLTYDITTVKELFDKPHSTLSPEEVAIKYEYAIDISTQENDFTKYTECLSPDAKQRFQIWRRNNNITEAKLKHLLDKAGAGLQDVSISAVASTINEKTAKVALVARKRKIAVIIVELVNTEKGWLRTQHLCEEPPCTYINGIGYCFNIFNILPNGYITKIKIKDKGHLTEKDISSKNMTVYDFLKQAGF